MARILASTLIFFGCIGVTTAQPPPGLDKAESRRRQMERIAEQRRAIQAGLAVNGLIVRRTWTPDEIDRWVFGRDAFAGRQQLEWQLSVHMDDIERACSLSDAQRKKLELAGRGDIKRFFDRYEEVKRKSQIIEHNERNFDELQQEAADLRTGLNSGLFQEQSLLVKSLRSTLTDEQFAQYQAKALKSRAFLHSSNVLNAVAMLKLGFEHSVASLGGNIVLREEQRQALITLMTRETKPPRWPGRYDAQFLILQLGRLPEEKLKRLFDRDQWEIMRRQLAQYQQLRQEGLLPIEDDGTEGTQK